MKWSGKRRGGYDGRISALLDLDLYEKLVFLLLGVVLPTHSNMLKKHVCAFGFHVYVNMAHLSLSLPFISLFMYPKMQQ